MDGQSRFDYEQFRRQAVQQLRRTEITLTSIRELLAPVVQDLLETALLRDDQTVGKLNECTNQIATEESDLSLDFDESFDNSRITTPLVQRHKARDAKAERYVLELFNKGFTYKYIKSRLAYEGWDLDATILREITSQILPQVESWRTRPLKLVYAYLWVTSIPVHSWQQAQVGSQTAYAVAGIDIHGERDVLGFYTGEHDLANLLPDLLADLQRRGVEDILIACVDEPNLVGKVFKTTYPQTQMHGCLMLQMQSTLIHLVGADKKAATRDLRALYKVSDEAQAEEIWQAFKADWAGRYPLIVESWERNWAMLIGPMQYPPLVRECAQKFKLIETLRYELLMLGKEDGAFINENEFMKSAYVVSKQLVSDYKVSVGRWGLLIQQLAILFGERVKKHFST